MLRANVRDRERTELMEYGRLGRIGLRVSELCLGAMMFGQWGNPDHHESIKIIHSGLDAGSTFIDTADIYSSGESDEIVGNAIAGRRDELVMATKIFSPMSENPNDQGTGAGSFLSATTAFAVSGPDSIDLYQIHRSDPLTDIDETLGAPAMWCIRARSATSAPRRSSLGRSSRRSRSPTDGWGTVSCANSRRTRSSRAVWTRASAGIVSALRVTSDGRADADIGCCIGVRVVAGG